MKRFNFIILFIGFAFISSQLMADRVACTSIDSVKNSADASKNNAAGGHLNSHIKGQTPPAGYSQLNKTMFASVDDWNTAYSALERQNPALDCNTAANIGDKAATHIALSQTAYQCTAVDANGKCTASSPVASATVTYVVKMVQNGESKNWIILTGYPRSSSGGD